MNWKKALGYGVLVWVVMYVLMSVVAAYLASGAVWEIIASVIVLVAVYFLARKIAPGSYGLALGYGAIFVVVGLVLDYLISLRFAPDLYSSTLYWVYYLLVLLAPLLTVKKTMAMPSQPQQQ